MLLNFTHTHIHIHTTVYHTPLITRKHKHTRIHLIQTDTVLLLHNNLPRDPRDAPCCLILQCNTRLIAISKGKLYISASRLSNNGTGVYGGRSRMTVSFSFSQNNNTYKTNLFYCGWLRLWRRDFSCLGFSEDEQGDHYLCTEWPRIAYTKRELIRDALR